MVGKFLLSTAYMRDVRFYRAVIYVCSHDDNGAMGLVINHPGSVQFYDVIKQLGVKPYSQQQNITVSHGGPVGVGQVFVLHSNDYKDNGTKIITPKISLTNSKNILGDLTGDNKPEHYIVALGYAGWGPGQIEEELAKNTWFMLEASDKFLFDHTTTSQKWTKAMEMIGIDPFMFVAHNGHS